MKIRDIRIVLGDFNAFRIRFLAFAGEIDLCFH